MAVPNLVTVFGGSGFVGRTIVQELARAGAKVRVAVRDPEAAMSLRPMGDVGQVTPIQANVRDQASIDAAIQGADAVVNLVGILYQSGAQTFDEIHTKAAERIALSAAKAGVTSFLHLSAIGADPEAEAHYAKSKGRGEQAVLAAFSAATILRPSIVFGPGDGFFNRFAAMAGIAPMLPLIGGGETKFQPVYVGDVARAALKVLSDPSCQGQIYELGGPEVQTFRSLLQTMLTYVGRDTPLVSIPFPLAMIKAALLELAPKPLLTRDQVLLLKSDNVVSEGAKGLDALGVTPTPVEAILPTYMDVYRTGGRFSPIKG